MEQLQKVYDGEIHGFNELALSEQFSSMIKLLDQYIPSHNVLSESDEEEETKIESLSSLDDKKLESIANEFKITYSDRMQSSFKGIRAHAYSQRMGEEVRKRLLRALILKFYKFLEILKAAHPKYYQGSGAQQILLELKSL